MSEQRVWIAQCLCPDRHCILAAADEADSEADAQTIKGKLRRQVIELLQSGALNPWCAICDAKRATWRYEVGRTKFNTLDEATPHLALSALGNAVANAVFGDLHKGKPN